MKKIFLLLSFFVFIFSTAHADEDLPPLPKGPMILTGRPQAIDVTIGGKAVAPLGEAEKTISDVKIAAADLLARTAPASTSTPSPAPAKGE